MRCLNCGEKVKSSQKYCLKCGCENKWTFKRKLLYFISLFLIIYFTYAFGLTILLMLFGLLFAQTVNPIELFMHLINPFNNSVDYNVAHFMAILIICFIVYFCLKASNSFIAKKAKYKNDNNLNNNVINTVQSNNENNINNQIYIRSQHTKEIGYTIIFLGIFVFALAAISSFISKKQSDKENEKQSLKRVELFAEKLNSKLREYHQEYGYDKTPSSYCDINPDGNPIMFDIQCDIEFDYWYGVELSHCLVNHRVNKSYGYDGKEAYVEKKKQFTKDSNQCLK